MSNSNRYLSDYVYLAEASYSDFSSARLSDNTYLESSVIKAISGAEDEGDKGKNEKFAKICQRIKVFA